MVTTTHNNNTAQHSPQFGAQSPPVSKPQSKAHILSSISHPAILWKELQAERKRSETYHRETEHYKQQFDLLNGGEMVDKLRHKVTQLTAKLLAATEENRALTSIQMHQEKQLMSEDMLEKNWPIHMAVLKQDLHAAKEQGVREQKKASELRRKGKEQQEQIVALKETNKTLKDIQRPAVELDPDKRVVDEKELVELEAKLAVGRSTEEKLRKSAESFQQMCKREVAAEKARGLAKDEEIKNLKKQLEAAKTDARQNILNMKELKRTLGGIAVGNMKVKEVASLLPEGDSIEVMDLSAIETILPQEVDVKRTKFLSPRPPMSEVKSALRYEGGVGGKRMNKTFG
jgi:hypothetical protein